MTTNQDRRFAGKVAFVTGAAIGIGRAAALAFAREGADVVLPTFQNSTTKRRPA